MYTNSAILPKLQSSRPRLIPVLTYNVKLEVIKLLKQRCIPYIPWWSKLKLDGRCLATPDLHALHLPLPACLPACPPSLPACLPSLTPSCLPALPLSLLPACLPSLSPSLPSLSPSLPGYFFLSFFPGADPDILEMGRAPMRTPKTRKKMRRFFFAPKFRKK